MTKGTNSAAIEEIQNFAVLACLFSGVSLFIFWFWELQA